MSTELSLLPQKEPVKLEDGIVQGVIDSQQQNNSSKCFKVVKTASLLAIPIITGSVSLATRFGVCKDVSSSECEGEHKYLHPVEIIGIAYTVSFLAAKVFKCCFSNN